MDHANHVSLSAVMSLENRLNTIAHNVANATTTGFRAEAVKFQAVVSDVASGDLSFVSDGRTYLTTESGSIEPTGNALDVAVKGNAWMAINTDAGRVYTRDGRLKMDENGSLMTVTGYAVLDVGGAPIQLDPAAGRPTIAGDGMISQQGRQLGAIGLFRFEPGTTLRRHEGSGVMPDRDAQPVLAFNDTGIVQGHLESSNVNPVEEITHLINVSRIFQAVQASIDKNSETQKHAIRTLGG